MRHNKIEPVAGAKKDLCGSVTLLVAVFMVGLVLPATMEEAHELPHLIVAELRLPFLRAERRWRTGAVRVRVIFRFYVGSGIWCMWAVGVYCGCKSKQTYLVLS